MKKLRKNRQKGNIEEGNKEEEILQKNIRDVKNFVFKYLKKGDSFVFSIFPTSSSLLDSSSLSNSSSESKKQIC